MSRPVRAARAALVIAVGVTMVGLASPVASAQRRDPVVGRAAPAPPPPAVGVPYPGATVTVDPRRLGPPYQIQHSLNRQHLSPREIAPATVVYYVPVPVGYGEYSGGTGHVTDANGRPLWLGSDGPAEPEPGYALGTPNFTGAPYVVGEGGVMKIDFGGGDVRAVPACAAVAASRDPDGRPRTIFYSPAVDGLVLRPGQRGRVAGSPPQGAQSCYTTDTLGRLVLDY